MSETVQQTIKTTRKIKRRLPLVGKRYVHSFPAAHLHRDFWSSLPNFTSELLVGLLVLGVAGFNIWSLYVIRPAQDGSLAADLLAYHYTVNPKLYAHDSSIKTTVVGNGGLVPEAFAETTQLLPGQDPADPASDSTADTGSDFVINDGAIVRPNPDSIKTLIQKQFQVYQVQNGDTLLSIAIKFHLNRSTLQWANKLPNYTVKTGWDILVPPVDGVTVTATANDTIPDLAKKYHGNEDTIVSYNGLENKEDIGQGQVIIIPGGYIEAPPAPKPAPRTGGTTLEDVGSTHLFPKGYCTYYVAHKMIIKGFGGDAKYWLGNAGAAGYETGSKAVAGSAVVTSENRRYGHVAYVQEVVDNVSDPYIVVSEMNFDHWNRVDTRRIPIHSGVIRGYIYPKY